LGWGIQILKEAFAGSIKNIYDLMAETYLRLGRFNPVEESNYPFERKQELYDCLALFSEETEDLLDEDVVNRHFTQLLFILNVWLLKTSDGAGYNDYLQLLIAIDQSCAYRAEHEFAIPDRFLEKPGLNSLHNDRVRVFSRLRDTFPARINSSLKQAEKAFKKPKGSKPGGFRKRPTAPESDVNEKLRNYILVDCEKVSPLTLHIPNGMSVLTKLTSKLESQKHLTFGVFPITNLNLAQICKLCVEGDYFYIERYHEEIEEHLYERYMQALAVCQSHKVDIAVFPEMILLETVKKKIIAYLRESPDYSLPTLLVLGSTWRDNANECIVLDDLGNTIFVQYKQMPFHRYDGSIERLDTEANQTIHYASLEGIGNIFTPICLDICGNHYQQLFAKIMPDLLIQPTYSHSLAVLAQRAEMYACQYWTTTVASNTCSAFCTNEEDERLPTEGLPESFGYFCIPQKVNTVNEGRTIKLPLSSTCPSCGEQVCPGTIIEVDYGAIEKEIGRDCFYPKYSVFQARTAEISYVGEVLGVGHCPRIMPDS
jgi:hypothetical protein